MKRALLSAVVALVAACGGRLADDAEPADASLDGSSPGTCSASTPTEACSVPACRAAMIVDCNVDPVAATCGCQIADGFHLCDPNGVECTCLPLDVAACLGLDAAACSGGTDPLGICWPP